MNSITHLLRWRTFPEETDTFLAYLRRHEQERLKPQFLFIFPSLLDPRFFKDDISQIPCSLPHPRNVVRPLALLSNWGSLLSWATKRTRSGKKPMEPLPTSESALSPNFLIRTFLPHLSSLSHQPFFIRQHKQTTRFELRRQTCVSINLYRKYPH